MTQFYDDIEPEIRETVKLLRDNGFNTTCSCGHEMYVEFEFFDSCEIDNLYNLLFNNGYRGFKITATVQTPPDGFAIKRMTLNLKNWM